jgi:hypothetical protein
LQKRKIAATLFAVLAMAVVAAGCGGGGDSTGGSGSTDGGSTEADSGDAAPTKADFIKEADQVCTAAENELSDEVVAFAEDHNIPIKKEEPSKAQQTELFHEVVLPNIARQAEELAALTPPEGDEATIEELTSTLEDEVVEAEEESGVSDTRWRGRRRRPGPTGSRAVGADLGRGPWPFGQGPCRVSGRWT